MSDEIVENFSLLQVAELPDAASKPRSRVFTVKGRKFRITVKTDGLSDPEVFFNLADAMSQRKADPKPLTVQGLGEPFTLTNASYIASLAILAQVATSPSFGLDEWAIFGKKAGALVMSQVIAFALEANGLDDKSLEAEIHDAGEDAGAEISPTASSAPVLIPWDVHHAKEPSKA